MYLIVALLALLIAPAAAVSQGVRLEHDTFVLPNGLRFIVHQDPAIPMVAVNVWYHVGSGYEEPGRTGFAHLFEHIMFEGSANVAEGDFDNLLEAAGAINNGSTNPDRTNYYEILPSNALALALWLEADRMGGLLETMSQQKLDIQREVVKNERRQSYENRPYGMFQETAVQALYPPGHPYSWSTIGSMDDLSAATLADVEAFFRRFYTPNNAVVAIAGDVQSDEVRELAERLFGWIPRGQEIEKPDIPIPPIPATRHIILEDRVTLPQVNLVWRGTEAFAADDAALSALARILTGGKTSRLYNRLVYEQQVAQSVTAFHNSQLISGDFYIRLTGREGQDLDALETAVLEEVDRIARTAPEPGEVARVVAEVETSTVSGLETLIGKAEQLNANYYYTGDPDQVADVLASYRALTPEDIQRVAREYLDGKHRIVISIVPAGRTDLGAGEVAR